MSYLALARKWRPTRFKEVVGQAHVLTALENALAQNRLHHAYLFSGTRGVGKTTIGRLFAKGLNCETGITATPCGECATCKEIDEGRFVDLLEIDAASRTKVEDTRELLDNVQYKPARGRFKVYLIDEVHMLSRHSFNALLKTLEEPPEYVKFLLATTDPQKLPVTILSRCLQFHLKPISVDDIHQQLDHVLVAEGVTAEARALGMIAHAADGSMRDALSLTDQAIALGNGSVLTESVTHMLGTLDADQALHLLEAISHKQAQSVLDTVQALAQNGVEWDGLLQQLATQLHRIALYQALPATLDKTQPDAEKVVLLSRALSPQDVQLYYQIALKGRDDLPLAPTERIGLEMILLRMVAFRPASAAVANVISTASSTPAVSASATPASQSVPVVPESHHQPSHASAAQPQSNQPPMAGSTASASHTSSSTHAPSSTSPATEMAPEYDLPPEEAFTHEEYVTPAQQSQQPAMQQQPPASKTLPSAETTPSAAEKASPISGLRHQLRSQRRGLKTNQPQSQTAVHSASTADSPLKKPSAASSQPASTVPTSAPAAVKAAPAKATSVIERVQQQHGGGRMSREQLMQQATQAQTPATEEDEAYRWKPSQSAPVPTAKKPELTPTEIKQALAHEKTPEMTKKLTAESQQQDPWAALIARLELNKLVEQLALNATYRKEGTTISLTLRADHAHLNTDKAQQELLTAFNRVLGESCHLSVTLGDEGTTPLELREHLYQAKLEQALASLDNDPHIQFIERRFAAQLDRDSVRPI